jgi:hypothetical protein
VYEDQLKLKGESEAKENIKPYENVMKSENKVSQERKKG